MLDNEHDWVRREIKLALDAGKRVIPVLLEGTPMPKASQLPPDIAKFAEQEAVYISAVTSRQDAAHLLAELGVEVGAEPSEQAVAPEPPATGGNTFSIGTVAGPVGVIGTGTVHNPGQRS
jgi:hypothetical protein